ncbi:DUF6301 family protein [Nocardia sp. NPDC004860]|uniref:DUF6301 family protein n=1 Tax=Nocardia sp. NPDC004860 TaxID=3154557 RepID=UPI0033AB1F39
MLDEICKIAYAVDVAARFDWTWASTDLERFCAVQGWTIVEHTKLGAVLTTNLTLARPEARWRSEDGRFERVFIFAAENSGTDDVEIARQKYDQFADISEAIVSTVGTPTQRKAGSDGEIRWDLPRIVIRLQLVHNQSFLEFANPEYQAWLDAPDEEQHW